MKKTDGSEKIMFSQLVTLMARKTHWEDLRPEYQGAFYRYFLKDRFFQGLCDVIYHNFEFYSEFEGLIFKKLTNEEMSFPNEDKGAYTFIQDRCLWNPFQVLYGKQFVILPYGVIEPETFDFNSFFSLVDTEEDIQKSLSNGIKIARLLKTSITEPKALSQNCIEIKKTILHPLGTYCLRHKPNQGLYVIEYGVGLESVKYQNEEALLADIIKNLESLRQTIKQNVPSWIASNIIEQTRNECCFRRLSQSVRRDINTAYHYWFPYEFSEDLLCNYESSGKGLPFKIRTRLEY